MLLPNSSKSMFVLRLLTIFRRNHRFPQIYLTWLTTVSEKPCDNGVQTVVHISVVFEGFTLNNSIGPKKDPPRRATPQPLTPWPQPKSHQGLHFSLRPDSFWSCLSLIATLVAPRVCLSEKFHFLCTSSMTSPRSLHPSSSLGSINTLVPRGGMGILSSPSKAHCARRATPKTAGLSPKSHVPANLSCLALLANVTKTWIRQGIVWSWIWKRGVLSQGNDCWGLGVESMDLIIASKPERWWGHLPAPQEQSLGLSFMTVLSI